MAELSDFGERRLVSEILQGRYGSTNPQFGDDVAIAMTIEDAKVLATTDPAPTPVSWELGIGDFYEWGWLLSAINLSDLAAAGATPISMVTSLTLPSSTPLDQFLRLLDGIDECNSRHGCVVVGGNLKDSELRAAEATALGIVREGMPFSRRGASPGDVAVVFGPSGRFWAGVLAKQRDVQLPPSTWDSLLKALTHPDPQVQLGIAAHAERVFESCTDTSDGVYGALLSLSADQGLGVYVDYEGMEYLPEVKHVAQALQIDPFRLVLGFGNLELMASIRPDRLNDGMDLADALGINATVLGYFDERPDVRLLKDQVEAPMSNFDNERFTAESQFTTGVVAYESRLLNRNLTR